MNVKRVLSWGIFSLITGCACYSLIYHQIQKKSFAGGRVSSGQGTAQVGGDFILTDQDGRKYSTLDSSGKYRLIYFGYSFCPDICPLGLQNMSDALRALGRDLDEIIPVFVTVDPERDTVQSLKIYAGNFHPNIRMLTGTSREIASVLKKYRVYAVKARPNGTMADYLMDHSTLIYLMDRNGLFLESFPHTVRPEDLAKSVALILAQEKKI